MSKAIFAVLVYDQPDPLRALQRILEAQALETSVVPSCGEAALSLWSERPPHLVFTDTHLSDGTWADVLQVAARAPAPVNAIVVSRCADVQFYIEAIERGAFDFLTPPFDPLGVAHVVRHAAADVLRRREACSCSKLAGAADAPSCNTNFILA